MSTAFRTVFLFCAAGFLLPHNWIPHHHHHSGDGGEGVHDHVSHDDHEGHSHDHSALAFLHIDEVFLVKSSDLKVAVPGSSQSGIESVFVEFPAMQFHFVLPIRHGGEPPPWSLLSTRLWERGPPRANV